MKSVRLKSMRAFGLRCFARPMRASISQFSLVNIVNTELKQRIQLLLCDVVANGDVAEELQPDDNLFQLGILDSVLLVRLVEKMEDVFAIAVEDRELSPDYFLSIERMALYVEHKINTGSTPAQP